MCELDDHMEGRWENNRPSNRGMNCGQKIHRKVPNEMEGRCGKLSTIDPKYRANKGYV